MEPAVPGKPIAEVIEMRDYYDFDDQELPVGFSMALAQNPAALERYAEMTPKEQEQLLRRTREVETREEMRSIVRELARRR